MLQILWSTTQPTKINFFLMFVVFLQFLKIARVNILVTNLFLL
jgi:hypothetical protein